MMVTKWLWITCNMKKLSDLRERCWPGYKSVKGKKAYSPGSCVKEDLRKWFDKDHPEGGWKRINSKGEAIGPCAREPGEPKPKCMSNEKRAKLSKKERASAVASKRKHDPNPERKGEPINVSNFGKGKISENMENLEEKNVPTSPEKWAQAKSQAKAKFDVYPSAYANGWAAKKYKEMGGGWKSVSEDVNEQHADVGRFEPVKPHNVKNVAGASPRRTSDSAIVKLKEQRDDVEEKNEMAQTQLHFIKYASKEILDYIEMGGEIEEWYQNKLSKVQSEVESLHSYIEGEKRRTGMVEEQSDLDESTPYYKKESFIKRMSKMAKQERLEREKKETENKQVKEEIELDEAVYSIKNTKTGQIYFHSKYPINKDNERLKKIKSAGGDHVHATPHKDGKPMNEAWNQPDYSQSIKARQAAADKKAIKQQEKPPLKEGENPQVKGGDPCWKGYQMVGKKKKNGKEVPNCVPANEQVANAPFDPPYSKKTGTHTDKSGAKHGPMSTAKHLAKMAAAKQVRELGKKTDPSRKGEIVKETMKDAKKKGEKKDQYNPEPTLTSQIIRTE